MSEFDENKGFDDFDDIDSDDSDKELSPKDADEDIQKSVYFSRSDPLQPITEGDIDEALASFDEDNFTDIDDVDDANVIREDDVTCTLDTPEANATKEQIVTILFGTRELTVQVIDEDTEIKARTGSDKSAVRAYTKKAVMPKITFAKPVKKMPFIKKLIIFLIACAAVGIYFGIEANSYFWFKDGQVEASTCAWSWIMVEKLPIVTSPIHTGVFMSGFGLGAGILGIIGLFIWLGNDEKKRSRVGHEHGNAQLGTKRDLAMHKRRFMD